MDAPIHPEPNPGSQKFAQLLNHPEQQQACEDISRLIEEVRRCSTPEDYRQMQQRLGVHINRVDTAVGQTNVRRARAEKQLRQIELREGGRGSPEAARLRTELEQIAFDRELYLLLGRQYRMVGDTMAWQLYQFQALPVFALGMNKSSGIDNTKTGAEVEAEEIERIWRDRGAFALRHDFTTCLRISDLSVFNLDHPDGPEIKEVKQKQKIPSSQKLREHIFRQLANHHRCVTQDGRVLLHLPHHSPPLSGPFQTNLSLLLSAVEESSVEGVGSAANDYLAVIVLNFPLLRFRPLTPPPPEKFLQPWEVPEEIVNPLSSHYIGGNSYDRLQGENFGAPYGVYPLFAPTAALLITGYIRVYYHLNLDALIPAFEAAGFKTECVLDEHRASRGFQVSVSTPFFRLRRGRITITVSGLPIGQALFEGLRIEDLAASMVTLYNSMAARGGIVLPSGIYCNPRSLDALSTHTNMEHVWRASRNYLPEMGA